MQQVNTPPISFTDHVLHYVVYGMTIDQAFSKVEGDLHGKVPEHIKAIARKELENIGRVK